MSEELEWPDQEIINLRDQIATLTAELEDWKQKVQMRDDWIRQRDERLDSLTAERDEAKELLREIFSSVPLPIRLGWKVAELFKLRGGDDE